MQAIQEKMFQWQERDTCYVVDHAQGSPEWFASRIGRATGSTISTALGRGYVKEDPSEVAQQIVGISKKTFTASSQTLMEHGVKAEPIIRESYARIIQAPIHEIGLAVWKQDVRFAGSLDGEMTIPVTIQSPDGSLQVVQQQDGLEIKAPTHVYRGLINHMEARRRGYQPPPGHHRHIFDSHYDQMMWNGFITNKSCMHYVVASTEDDLLYSERLPVDEEHFRKVLYEPACLFYETHVEPLLHRHGIVRVDPPVARTS